jgi:hypothetical protein
MSNLDYEAGYVAALMQLQNKIRLENPNPTQPFKTILQHIQDLIANCPNCGSKVFGDGSCLTCEQSKKPIAKAVKK